MWRSGHLGDQDWDAEIAELEKQVEAREEEKPMVLADDDEGLGGDEEGCPSPSGEDQKIATVDENNNVAATEQVVPSIGENAGVDSVDLGIDVGSTGFNIDDIELDNEICEIMEGAMSRDELLFEGAANAENVETVQDKDSSMASISDSVNVSMFKALDLSAEDKEAMARSDDLANLNKIDEAMSYCDAVLKALHPKSDPNELEVSVWEAELKDEKDVELLTEL